MVPRMPLPRRTLGQHGPEVGSIGYGAMGLSWAYGNREGMDPDAVIHRAIDLGCTLIDTADVYGPFHNEITVGHAIKGRRDEVVLATKCGLVVDDVETREIRRDGRPEHIREAIDGSLRRLEADHVDLYYLHRPDPEVPIEESVGALEELRREGKVRLVGLSNVSVEQLRRAQTAARVVSVQNEFNRGLLTSEPVLEACAAEGIAFIPWGPLGESLREPRHELRWLLDRAPVVLPIPGTSKVAHLEENMRVVSDRPGG
jgi:aryl-alcohol dehydrogenase-like predicted oxidoreductase